MVGEYAHPIWQPEEMKHKAAKQRPKSFEDPNVYPYGWNYERIQKVIRYYDRLKDMPLPKHARVSKSNSAKKEVP
jgi:hypothetical protein